MTETFCFTLKTLNDLCAKYNIPEDVQLWSDSGWECNRTEMGEAYYNEKLNIIVFTQFTKLSMFHTISHIYEDRLERKETSRPEDWKYLEP